MDTMLFGGNSSLIGDGDCIYFRAVCKDYPFWNRSGFSPHSNFPQVTICFQTTVLNWLSCGILWLILPFYAAYLNRKSDIFVERMRRRKRSCLNIFKLVVGMVQILIPLIEIIVIGTTAPKKDYLQFMLSSVIRFATMIIAWSFTSVEYTKAIYTSAVLTMYWFLYVLINAFSIYAFALSQYFGKMEHFEKLFFGLLATEYALALFQFLVNSFFVDRNIVYCMRTTNLNHSITESRINLLDSTNDLADNLERVRDTNEKNRINSHPTFMSSIFFAWVIPLLYRGLKREHKSENLPDVPTSDLCSSLFPEFDDKLRSDMEDNQYPGAKNSNVYTKRLILTMLPAVFLWGFVRVLTVVLLIVNLFIFRRLINYVKDANEVDHQWLGYLLAIGLFFVAFIRALCVVHWLDGCDRVGLRLKILISTTVYRKMLKLSSSCAAQGMDIGYISNLMSVDSLKLFQFIRSLHEIVTMPIYLVLALIFMYQCLGEAGIIGIVCLIVVVPGVTFGLAHLNRNLQEEQMVSKDKRLKYISEILAGMKVLKLYAWEDPFEEKVNEIRRSEMKAIWKGAIINGISNVVCLVSPFLVSLIVFAYHIYGTKHTLDPSDAFVCLSLICMLNCSISVMPCSLSFLIQGLISIKKAATLMDMDEVEGDLNRIFTESGPAASIENASFSWDGTKECLKNINFHAYPGKLIAIVGLVGSGKSSMLASLLGEMKTMKGAVKVREKTIYVSQQAWIQNCTIRENICLNRPYIENKYRRIVEACHLNSDFDKFSDGDLTVVGGKGANLSGGQRQRINLARAVYTKADLYLIDDSLSAVDPKVAHHIFKEVIGLKGVLRKSTRIFATNSIGFLPEMDLIVVMNNGVIEATGTYEEIVRMEGEYFDFIREHSSAPEMSISTADPYVVMRRKSFGPGSLFPFVTERDINSTKRRLSNYEMSYRIGRSSSFKQTMSVDNVDMSGEYIPDDSTVDLFSSSLSSAARKEKMIKGQKWKAVGNYIRSGGYLVFIVVCIGHLVMLMSQSASYVWLQIWMDDVMNTTTNDYIVSYSIIGVVEIISIITVCLTMAIGFSNASKVLHDRAVYRLFRAPISYFETTSLGQIFNYLSTDMDTVDCALPLDTQLWLISFCVVISSVGTIAWADPTYLAITLPIIVVSAIVQRIYGKSAIQLRREYAIKKTPVYSHFEESISGVVSVRSYRKEQLFIKKSDKLTDESHRSWHSYLVCWRWYTLFNELMGVLAIFLTAVTAIELQRHKLMSGNELSPGRIGLALFSIFQVLPHIPIATRMMIEVEAHIVAVERLIQCANIIQEASREAEPGLKPVSVWPFEGRVEFRDMCAKYQTDLDNALKNINLLIEPGHKVGVVGETGAGKSSLIMSLFRMMEANQGCIVIDNIDISRIGLHDLRSRLTCVPQEPILFSGTLRNNLDALEKFPDDELWRALEQAQLKDFISANMPGGLDHVINSEEEVCVGQRQMICLARALLRNSKIIILDEPTAAVDYQTDQIIQLIIRKEFESSTVITVAHRLATIKDYNRILVLDRGKVLEYDSPENLLSNPRSKFSEMDRIDRKENDVF